MGFEEITSDAPQIATELADRVLTITLNRPDRLNAWTGQMGAELMAAFDRSDADDEVRAVIVTGAGRGFCAGADLGTGGDTFDYRKRDADGPAARQRRPVHAARVPVEASRSSPRSTARRSASARR